MCVAPARLRACRCGGGGGGGGGGGVGGGEGEGGGEGGGEGMDMVDALHERLLLATLRHAREQRELCLTSFSTTPVAAELRVLLPQLSGHGLLSLDVSYCLELDPRLLGATLGQMRELEYLDASCCGLHDAGAAAVAAALLNPRCVLRSVRLRANRIGPRGAGARWPDATLTLP